MIILLQSVTMQFRRLFRHISSYKVRQSNFITKCDRLLLQSASGITKCDRLYYKVRQVLQSVTVITKWDVTDILFWKLNIEVGKTKIKLLKTSEDTPLLFYAVHFLSVGGNFPTVSIAFVYFVINLVEKIEFLLYLSVGLKWFLLLRKFQQSRVPWKV